ncbi:MAG: hypothetical protein R3218_00535 [Christiangramia sp.]|nr:hypothetical protein [Christiangramia sp.]
MDSTIEKSSWDSAIWTSSSDIGEKQIAEQYNEHFTKVNQRAYIHDAGNFWFNSQILENSKEDYLNHLIDYKIPQKDIVPKFILHNYAQKFTKLKGFVTSINEDYFSANLLESNEEGTYEIGEFDLMDVDEDDRELLNEGAVFYWTFGHFVHNGQVKKQSEIRFQRLPQLGAAELDKIFDEAKDLNDSLNWD